MVAPGSVAVTIANAAGVAGVAAATVKVRVALVEFVDDPKSFNFTPNENRPLTVGVPEMIPLAAARDSPDGRLPELMLHRTEGVSPVAAILAL
jgi:hypothetical protein